MDWPIFRRLETYLRDTLADRSHGTIRESLRLGGLALANVMHEAGDRRSINTTVVDAALSMVAPAKPAINGDYADQLVQLIYEAACFANAAWRPRA